VISLLGLYGGINPEYVFHVYLGTFTTVLFVAGLSILISTVARRPRDAILAAYGLEAAWIYGTDWISPFAHDLRGPFFWVGTVNDWMIWYRQRLDDVEQPVIRLAGTDEASG
jgi:hypothetical protein